MIVKDQLGFERNDLFELDGINLSFLDVVASCDAVITKPGYGTFVESACHGAPVLYTRRQDWPEEGALINWLNDHVNNREISRDSLYKGELHVHLDSLWKQAPVVRPGATGVENAVNILLSRLD